MVVVTFSEKRRYMACRSAEDVFAGLPFLRKKSLKDAQLLFDAFCCFILPANPHGVYKWEHFVEQPSQDLLLIQHPDPRDNELILANGRFYNKVQQGYVASQCAVSFAAACAEARSTENDAISYCAMLAQWTPSAAFQLAAVKTVVQQKFQLRQHANELQAICKRELKQLRYLPLPHVFMGAKNGAYEQQADGSWTLRLDVCDFMAFGASLIAHLPFHGNPFGIRLERGICFIPLQHFWSFQPFHRKWQQSLVSLKPAVYDLMETKEHPETTDGLWQLVYDLYLQAQRKVEQRLKHVYADGTPPACIEALWEKAITTQRWDNAERYQLGYVINALGALQLRDMEPMYADYAVLMRHNKFGEERIRHFLATNRLKHDYVRCARRRPGVPGITCPHPTPEACLAGRVTKNGRPLYPDSITIADVWTFSTTRPEQAISGRDADSAHPGEDSDSSINEDEYW